MDVIGDEEQASAEREALGSGSGGGSSGSLGGGGSSGNLGRLASLDSIDLQDMDDVLAEAEAEAEVVHDLDGLLES